MPLVKPSKVDIWGEENKKVFCYQDASIINSEIEDFVKNDYSIMWLPTKAENKNEEPFKNNFTGHIVDSDFLIKTKRLMKTVTPHMKDYREKNGITWNKYTDMTYIKTKKDNEPMRYEEEIRDYETISVILYYINDDYRGGELHFPKIDLTIHPQKNQLVCFPVNMKYEVSQITKGTQYLFMMLLESE